jgi:glutamate-1-semialdehyde aminotransferase
MGKGQELYKKAKTLIPGGTQLLSKRPEMFLPEKWPAYFDKAAGCEVWDLDGNKYTDVSYMGIGSCVLGYADLDVNTAVKEVVDKGTMCTLNAPEEVKLAEVMIEIHPWADMARYTKSGGEAMAVAVRIARAKTKKDIVLFCGYHGWHDWYLASNLGDGDALDGHLLPGLNPAGTPRSLKGTSFSFNYNDKEDFLKLVDMHKSTIGVIVMESIRNDEPDKDFIDAIMEVRKREGAVLIVDEITAGFRVNAGGAHLLFGIEPDIAVFAKGISNGYPMGIVIGKRDVMNAAQESFISSTYWTERIGPVAAIATINKFKNQNVSEHLVATGKRVFEIWKSCAEKNDLQIDIGGIYPLGHFAFSYNNPLLFKTLFTQIMLEKGFLANTAFYLSYAHKAEHIDKYEKAVKETFEIISESISRGDSEKMLKGPVCHGGFKRLN